MSKLSKKHASIKSIISLKIWYNCMSSFLFHSTIIPVQVTLLGVHHCPHDLQQSIIPIQQTFLAVKVLGMLQHTNPLSLNWSWYWETFIYSSCQNAPFLKSKNRQKGDQFLYQMSDFCENCNPHSSYHDAAVGECLVDIWFAEICQLTLCVFGSQSMLSKSTRFLYGSQLQIHTMLYVMKTY